MRKIIAALLLGALAGCDNRPLYHVPPGLTPQTGATLTGIVNPMPNIISTGTHICADAIDGALTNQACDTPILVTAGTHTIEISADFHPFPAEFGFTTVIAKFAQGQTYFIRATGGPVQFRNSNGMESLPATGLTVWIESRDGTPIIDKTLLQLQAPPGAAPILFLPK